MLLFWPLVIPFGTAVLTLLAWRWPALQRLLSLAGALALFAVAARIAWLVAARGPFAQQAGGWPAPFGISMVADGLSATMVLLTGLVAVAVTLFGLADLRPGEEAQGNHPLTHGLLAGLCGAFLTGDIFNLYVWFEVMLIASFGLLVVGGSRAQIDGAVKYVGLNLIATVAFITAVGLLYGATGALNMADLHTKLAGRGGETPILASAAMLIFAFGAKAAIFPLYFWLPASYHTPSFATSALFASLLTKVGVYALIRAFTLVYDVDGTPIETLLVVAALVTMALGAAGGLARSTIRQVLGFGIIASVGYMILGLAIGTGAAILGALFYLFQDVLVKAALFLVAGAAARLTGSEDFRTSGGIWRARPGFALLFLIPALSLAGVPPLSGFWAKLLLLLAAMETGRWVLAFAVLATGLFILFAMARIWGAVFWAAHPGGADAITARLPVAMLAPIVVLVALIVYAGVDAGRLIAAVGAMAEGLIDPAAYVTAVLGEAP